MRKALLVLLGLPLALVLILALGLAVVVQQQLVSKSDLKFLVDLHQRDGLGAVAEVIRSHFFGVDLSNAANPSYGREPVAGRGRAPWVIRGNLDDRPRMLVFALAPGRWAAYDTERASLYQLWQGELKFQGAAYDYVHGPQPLSEGAWQWRDAAGARWFLLVDGEELPASVQYLGHEYGPDHRTAALRFALTAGEHRAELTEWPDLATAAGDSVQFTRRFQYEGEHVDDTAPRAGFYTGGGERFIAAGTLTLPLSDGTAIAPAVAGADDGYTAEDDVLARGEAVIAGNDCLGCHAPQHRVTGPSWSQVSGKFRGRVQQDVVAALARNVREGSVGVWGKVPMPPHPALDEADARAAVSFILSVGEPDAETAPPLNAAGQPYAASYDYDILPRLTSLHPSFALDNVAPDGFEPKVGGMDFRRDGKLLVASWDADGAVFLIDPAASPATVTRIAEGLHEPLGLTVVDDRIFVLQKQELTELVDTDGDERIDRYRAVSYDWPGSANFHSFAFGLLHQDDAFHFLLSICVLPGGASCPEQLPTQGKLLRIGADGKASVLASGFRTPNGIAGGSDGAIYVTDNQGDWLPSSKFLRIEPGAFYGSRAVPDPGVMERTETPPAVWLPQDEVGNSPTQPLQLTEGPYAGQWIHGDVYNGGIKRVFLEEVSGVAQGAVFHFSAGFQGGVNRLLRGPDGAIYVGEVGNPPNWGEYGKPWYGLERLRWAGDRAFELRAVRATTDGFALELTHPLAAAIVLKPGDLSVKQWFYHPNEQYGGPKYDETALSPAALTLSEDRRVIRATIPGLRAHHVVYLRLNERLRDVDEQKLWTAEAWYTLNAIPGLAPTPMHAAQAAGLSGAEPRTTEPDVMADVTPADTANADTTVADMTPADTAAAADGWRPLFDGRTLDGWRNYGGSADNVRKWTVQDGTIALQQAGPFPMWDMIKSAAFGGGSADLIYYREAFRNFELTLEWKIAENGNSGIFYLVADETEKNPWLTGIEMQVLHNEGHRDGNIETHRAGDLYDLIAADPVTVKPPGEWNAVRIRVQDNHIEHWLNGVKVVSVTRGGEQWNALVAASKFADMPRFGRADTGYIVLQDHGDPVWYRNIRVRELPATE